MIQGSTPGIHDLTWSRGDLPSDDRPATLLAMEDHWLRRVARVEHILLASGQAVLRRRQVADEVWALLEGHLRLELTDTRATSPTFGARQTFELVDPTRVLVPFGVTLRAEARRDTSVIRMMTHSEVEDPPATD